MAKTFEFPMNPRSFRSLGGFDWRRAYTTTRFSLNPRLVDDEMEEKTIVQRKKENSYKDMPEMIDSKPKQQSQLEQQIRNWLDLPYDVMANILYRVGVIDILENAQKVCTTWHKICKDPAMWRVIHMKILYPNTQIREMCKDAVNRSQGQLVDIGIVDFVNDELLQYIADRSSQLKRLNIEGGLPDVLGNWAQAFKKFAFLEELDLYRTRISKKAIETAGRCCPMLKTLKVNHENCIYWHGGTDEESLMVRNNTAIAIGFNLPGLRHLELIGNNMTNIGLLVILVGCRHLESLDLRQCLYIDLKGDVGKECIEKIKCLKFPEDSLEGCPYIHRNDCILCNHREFFAKIRSFDILL
ncbi:hypothetical protein L1887_23593 [Cichorium endivia]|nr:hypothetical protein L1887_23593 [Cichorium endivia]